jgi:hypothetical protein
MSSNTFIKMKKKKPEPKYHPGNRLELFTFEFEKNTNISYWYLIESFLVSFMQKIIKDLQLVKGCNSYLIIL